jgi:hypothetical protein
MAASFRVGRVIPCLMCVALATAVVCGAPPEKAANADKLTKLFEERAQLADQDFAACQVAYEAGTLALDSLLAATKEFAEAKLELCKTKAERIAVRVKQVERAKVREGRIMALNGVQAVGGEFDKLARAGVERVKAEIAMEEESRVAAAETGEKRDESIAKLLEERAKLADQAYQECAAGYKQDVVTLDSLLAALNELADAKLRLCKSKAERIAVLEKQVERALDIEADVKALNDVAARGGEVDKLARAGVQRAKAEIELVQEKGEKGDDKLTKLFDERAKLADQAYQTCALGYEKETVTLDVLMAAINELADAKLALCKTKSERIAVLERQVERAKKHESAIRVLSDRQVRGGEADKVARAGVDRVKAEIALELEKRDAADAAR